LAYCSQITLEQTNYVKISYIGTLPVFKMYGGKISDNTVEYGNGGGIYSTGVFKMYGGIISGNTAMYGGGVCNNYGNFSMFGGVISGNTADYGGGVYAGGGYANFDWVGGVISGNTAAKEGNDVYPDSGGSGGNGSGGGSGGNGSGSGGNGGSSNGDGFSLRDVIVICVGVVGLMVGVIIGLLFYFRRKVKYVEEKLNRHVVGQI